MAYQGTSLCAGVFGKDAARIASIEFEKKSFTLCASAFLASVLLEIIKFILT